MENPDSQTLCKAISERTAGECVLFFSRGKDAIGAWLELRRHFTRIVPVFQYLVPGLEFEEDSLAYFERFFGQRIIRLPNPGLYRMLNNHVFQPRDRLDIIDRLELYNFDYDKLSECVTIEENMSMDCFTATGVRISDSLNRRASIKKYGPKNEKRKTFFPVWDWNNDRLYAELKASGVKLPIDYKLWGRTFDGIDWRFLKPLKENLPRDYARVLEFFPLAEAGLRRMEYRQKWHASKVSTV